MSTIKTDMDAIIKRIKDRRLELGYSFQDLAEKTNMSKSTLQRYETGAIGNVPLDKLEVLAKALFVSPAYLMGWDEEKPEPETKDDPLMVVAAHHSDYDWSEEQLKEIDRFINFVKQEKNNQR